MVLPVTPPYHRQVTYFTCGPACLMMALESLNKLSEPPSERLELDFWRRSNAIYMGHDMPGCGPYGLGCLALEHGCRVTLFTNRETGHFDTWNTADARRIAGVIEEHDRTRFAALGGTIDKNADFAAAIPRSPHVFLVLTGEDVVEHAHWVCLLPDGKGGYLLFDPEPDDETSDTSASVMPENVQREMHYLGVRAYLRLSV